MVVSSDYGGGKGSRDGSSRSCDGGGGSRDDGGGSRDDSGSRDGGGSERGGGGGGHDGTRWKRKARREGKKEKDLIIVAVNLPPFP